MTVTQSRWRKYTFDLAKILCTATLVLIPLYIAHSIKLGGIAEHPMIGRRYLFLTLPATVIALITAFTGQRRARYWIASLATLGLFFWWFLAIDVDVK